MANLDAFFAKKDKKKSKARARLLATSVPNLEEPQKVAAANGKEITDAAKANPDLASAAGDVADVINNVHENVATEEEQVDEEWKNFQKDQRKDYSGLKIALLTNTEEKPEPSPNAPEESDGTSESNSNGDSAKAHMYFPWKILVPAESVPEVPVEIEPKKSPKVYVLPALRKSQELGYAAGNRPSRSKIAPDITNNEYFPSLSAARPVKHRKKKAEPVFEEVRNGSRKQRDKKNAIGLDGMHSTNRFQSLCDEEDDNS